jgi:hypothetical protein
MSKSSSGSSFLRLKFKPNNKNAKPSVKTESTKKRKREKQCLQGTTDSPSVVESNELDVTSKKQMTKIPQPRIKELKKDLCKLKIRIGKNEAAVVSSQSCSTSMAEKAETLSFNTTTEKKIKTLLPKRSVPDVLSKTFSPTISSPESPISASASLSSVYHAGKI